MIPAPRKPCTRRRTCRRPRCRPAQEQECVHFEEQALEELVDKKWPRLFQPLTHSGCRTANRRQRLLRGSRHNTVDVTSLFRSDAVARPISRSAEESYGTEAYPPARSPDGDTRRELQPFGGPETPLEVFDRTVGRSARRRPTQPARPPLIRWRFRGVVRKPARPVEGQRATGRDGAH